MDINRLLDQYCQGIKEALGDEILATTSVNGAVYGVLNFRAFANNVYLNLRNDVFENAGVYDKLINAKTWVELEEVFQAVKDNDETYPLGGQSTAFRASGAVFSGTNLKDSYMYDYLGDPPFIAV